MRDFNIFLDVGGDWIPVSSPLTSDTVFPFSTYNEELSEGRNSQYTLSFSVVSKQTQKDASSIVHSITNPLLSYYYIGAKMYLILDQQKRIDFIIKSIQPATSQHNTIWNIVAEDEVTYLWAKHNVKYSYKTENRNTGIVVPKNIYQIGKEILADNYLDGHWSITSQTQDPRLSTILFVLDVVDTNPYNALIEACNIVGADLIVNYNTKRLDFVSYKNKTFSGYRYTPTYNLNSYDSSYAGDNIATILHVEGGVDVDNRQITMVPPMPHFVKKYIGAKIDEGCESFDDWSDISDYSQEQIRAYIPSYAFVPIVKCVIIDGSNRDIMEKGTYNIRFDNVTAKYYGEISFPVVDNKSTKNYLYSFVINPDSIHPFGKKPESEDGQSYTTVILSFYIDGILQLNKVSARIFQNDIDIKQYRKNIINIYQSEHNSFFKIVEKNPHLGQSLIDFTPFRHKIEEAEWDRLNALINTTWRNLNIQSQYYTNEFYTHSSLLFQLRQTFIHYAELYAAACAEYEKELLANTKKREIQWDTYLNNINKYAQDLENVIKNSKYFDIIQTLGTSIELDIVAKKQQNPFTYYFDKLLEQAKTSIDSYRNKILELCDLYRSPEELNGVDVNVELQYYQDAIKTTQQLCSHFSFTVNNNFAPGAYELIIQYITKYAKDKEIDETSGIAFKLNNIQQKIVNNVFKELYSYYGQFIYEQTYSNTDELDSINLYNQAIEHFAELNKIAESHSLTTLDIGMLECITTPRLSVGNIIQVYNKDSLKSTEYAHILSRIEKIQSLYNYYQANNNTTKMDSLRNDLDALYKELVTYYQHMTSKTTSEVGEILNDIYTDEIQVTGITRVLREPLKDSVTVEQPSRYQSILAKLIKSI